VGRIGRHRREEEAEEPNLTPMLDVVFILLIFFIVTASFVKEAGIEVNRPDAVTAVPQQRASILIAIDENQEIWVQRRRIDLRAVRANVERLLAENPQGSVVIQADEKSDSGILIKVLDQAKLAGAENVAVAAQPVDP